MIALGRGATELPPPQIPVVMVVMQGSIGASIYLRDGLAAATPAVIVYGSGGVSDVVVNLVRHSKEISRVSETQNPYHLVHARFMAVLQVS